MQTNYNNELQVNNSTQFESVCIWCDLQFKNLWWKWVVYMFTMYSNWRNVIWKDETREGDSRKIDFDQQTHQFDTGYMCLSKKWDHRPYTVARDFYLYFMLTCFFYIYNSFYGITCTSTVFVSHIDSLRVDTLLRFKYCFLFRCFEILANVRWILIWQLMLQFPR